MELRCARGEMSAVIAENAQFDEDVKIIVMVVVGFKIVALMDSMKVKIFNEDLEIISEVKLNQDTMDICSVGNAVVFLHDGSVSVDTLSSLEDGKFEPGVLVGAVKSSRADGSGNTSSVKNATCLASYQKSILVGTKDGRVKIISLLKPIAEFYNQTFLPAVRGFGLHKKNQKGSEARHGILRERVSNARGRFISYCGRICGIL